MSEDFKDMVHLVLANQAKNVLLKEQMNDLRKSEAISLAEAVLDACDRGFIDSEDCLRCATAYIHEDERKELVLELAAAVVHDYGNTEEEDEEDDEELRDHSFEELKAAAFEVLLLNPGSERQDWIDELVENYGIEVVDAYGTDPNECFSSLADLWDDVYLDPATDMEKSYSDWAQTFCTRQSVDLYYELVEERKRK